MHLTPAEYLTHVFQGVRATARIVGRDPSGVSRWKKSKTEGGLDGRIPGTLHALILEHAVKNNLDINADDLIFGRSV